jgi:3-deoxy-D-manno-octulosonic-acid transferase
MKSIFTFCCIRFYALLSYLIYPLILRYRLLKGKEDCERVKERQGIASGLSFDTSYKIIWFHGASVGETLSALPIIKHMVQHHKHIRVLLTSGTRASAQILAQRLNHPDFFNVVHQYMPLDNPVYVDRFLSYWHIDYAIWIESEFWPNMMRGLTKRNIPLTLMNARLSEKSAIKWSKIDFVLRFLLKNTDYVLAQSAQDAARLSVFTPKPAVHFGNIKYMAAPLGYDADIAKRFQSAINGRPVMLYASTHAGEERIAYDIHHQIKKDFPSFLTIIVPRHPLRTDKEMSDLSQIFPDLKSEISHDHHDVMRAPSHDTDIFWVNRMGELGLYYHLSPLAFIGRTLSDDRGGGHNPYEAVQLGCIPVYGYKTQNLQNMFDDLKNANIGVQCNDAQALYHFISGHLKNTQPFDQRAFDQRVKLENFVADQQKMMHDLLLYLTPILSED